MKNPSFFNDKDLITAQCGCGNVGYIAIGPAKDAVKPTEFQSSCPKCGKKLFQVFCKKCENGYLFPEDANKRELQLEAEQWYCSFCKTTNRLNLKCLEVPFLQEEDVPADILKKKTRSLASTPAFRIMMFVLGVIILGNYLVGFFSAAPTKTFLSPNGEMTLIATKHVDKTDVKSNNTILLTVERASDSAVLYKKVTRAAWQINWSLQWIDDSKFELHSSDIGTHCFEEAGNFRWEESPC